MNPLFAYLGSVLGVLGIGCGTIAYLEVSRPEGYNSQVTYAVIGLCTMVLTQLLSMVRSFQNGKAVEEVKQVVTVAAEKASVAAVKAEEAASVAARNP